MNQVIVVGAGDFGRELYCWFRQSSPHVKILGFIDDNLNALNGYDLGVQILGKISDHEVRDGVGYLMGIADPGAKLKVAALLTERGARFETYIHPSALVSDYVRIDTGVVLCPYVVVSCHGQLSDFVAVNLHSTIGHDVVVGAGTTISSHVDLCGHVKVGEGVFIGSHAVVLPNVKVGDHARLGAGSVAMSRVKEGSTVFGIPAKKL